MSNSTNCSYDDRHIQDTLSQEPVKDFSILYWTITLAVFAVGALFCLLLLGTWRAQQRRNTMSNVDIIAD